jgi:hypothetical protein
VDVNADLPHYEEGRRPTQTRPERSFFWWRLVLCRADCVGGHVGLELGNVVANYPFERSLRFLEAAEFTETISRLSCGAWDT